MSKCDGCMKPSEVVTRDENADGSFCGPCLLKFMNDAEAQVSSLTRERDALQEQLARANKYIDGNDLRSDYQTATQMRMELEHLQATVEKCRAAGFIDEKGEVRKVLGTLPLTADGCVFGAGYPTCWIPSLAVGAVRAHTTTNGEDGGHEPSEVYSTRQAAERAKGVE